MGKPEGLEESELVVRRHRRRGVKERERSRKEIRNGARGGAGECSGSGAGSVM